MNVRTVELGCERGWRRAQWRMELAIPKSVPCLGILGALGPKAIDSVLRPLGQELRWAIPGLRIGILETSPKSSIHPSFSGIRSSEPFQVRANASHASQVLDWICGVDVWLNLGDCALTHTVTRIAADIRLPISTFNPLEEQASQNEAICLAQSLAKQFQVADARPAMLALEAEVESVRAATRPMTVDEALRLLEDSFCATLETWESEAVCEKTVGIRPAA